VLEQLQQRFPELRFTAGERFCWSPKTHEIIYDTTRSDEPATWSLLHETGHALLNHQSYLADFELLQIEMAAWQRARSLAIDFGITIDEDHIQDCLDTYRDWLYKRSICPQCSTKALQQNDYRHYRCFNCHTVWKVTPSRFCRSYRATKGIPAITNPLFT
jgi:hypothetical protein